LPAPQLPACPPRLPACPLAPCLPPGADHSSSTLCPVGVASPNPEVPSATPGCPFAGPGAEPCRPGLRRCGHGGPASQRRRAAAACAAWRVPARRPASPARSGAPALAACRPAGLAPCWTRGRPALLAALRPARGRSRRPAPPRRAADLWGTKTGAAQRRQGRHRARPDRAGQAGQRLASPGTPRPGMASRGSHRVPVPQLLRAEPGAPSPAAHIPLHQPALGPSPGLPVPWWWQWVTSGLLTRQVQWHTPDTSLHPAKAGHPARGRTPCLRGCLSANPPGSATAPNPPGLSLANPQPSRAASGHRQGLAASPAMRRHPGVTAQPGFIGLVTS